MQQLSWLINSDAKRVKMDVSLTKPHLPNILPYNTTIMASPDHDHSKKIKFVTIFTVAWQFLTDIVHILEDINCSSAKHVDVRMHSKTQAYVCEIITKAWQELRRKLHSTCVTCYPHWFFFSGLPCTLQLKKAMNTQ